MSKIEHISLSDNEKLGLISNLATMLTAGIPILEVVDSLLEDSKGNLKIILTTMRDDMTEGKHVYTSFSKFPNTFSKVTVNLIKASEEAGTLDITLKDLKASIKKDTEFKDKIKSALTYPVIIFMVFLGVFIMILTFVVPKISSVFMRLKVDLPLPTKVMIYLSDLILHYTVPLLAGLVFFSVIMVIVLRANRQLFTSFLSSLPVVSSLIKDIDLARFSRGLFLLLNSGIPITSALELSQEIVMRKDVRNSIMHAKEVVLSGKKISEGFRDKKHVIPSIVIKITEAGEKTGSLDKSMQDISEFMDYEVENRLRAVTTLMEPIMLVFVGVLIGGMMMAIIAPIYGLISQVGSR